MGPPPSKMKIIVCGIITFEISHFENEINDFENDYFQNNDLGNIYLIISFEKWLFGG